MERVFKNEYDINLIRVNAEDLFLEKLAGVSDPETKRKIIGEAFIRVFEGRRGKKDGARGLSGARHNIPRRDRIRRGPRGHHQEPPQTSGACPTMLILRISSSHYVICLKMK